MNLSSKAINFKNENILSHTSIYKKLMEKR